MIWWSYCEQYLIFVHVLLYRTKLQQTHVDQLLQVLVEWEEVFPDMKNPETQRLELQVYRTNVLQRGEEIV